MTTVRIAFCAVLLACVSAIAPAPAQGVWPGGGVKADDYDPGDRLADVRRADGQPLTAGQRARFNEVLDYVRRTVPRRAGETDDAFNQRALDVTVRALVNEWRRAASQPEPGPLAVQRQLGRPGMIRLTPDQQEVIKQEARRDEEDERIARQTAPGNDSFVSVYRSTWPSQTPSTERQKDLYAQHRRWCDNNPEPCAREQRRIAAQEARAANEERRRGSWQVMHIRQRVCQPLSEWISGAATPQDALAAIRRNDPDAEFFDAAGVAGGKALVSIETSGETVNLARDYGACVTGFRMLGR